MTGKKDVVSFRKDEKTDYKTVTERVINEVTQYSTVKQVCVGGITGWAVGYLFSKVGKVTALALGSSLLVLQIAQHKGYIKINWNKVEEDYKQLYKQQEETKTNMQNVLYEVQQFARQNVFLAGGFTGGFLIGLSL